MIDLYLKDLRTEERGDRYNKLTSVTAQAILEAAQDREDARLEKQASRAPKEPEK